MPRWFSTIRGQVFSLALLPLSFLVLVLVLVALLRFQTEQATDAVRSADEALAQSSKITSTLMTVQRDVGRYFVNQSPADLRAAQRDSALVLPMASRLRQLVQGNPPQERRAAAISNLASQILAVEQQYLKIAAAGDRTAAEAVLSTPHAHQLADAWQRETTAFAQQQIAVRDARWAVLQRSAHMLDLVIGAGAALAFLLTLFAARSLGLHIVVRLERLRRKTRRVARGEDPGAQVQGTDEIAELDRAYHQMALAVHEREAQLQKYRLLSQHARDIILFVRRADGKIVEANAAAAQAYGYTIEELETLHAPQLRAPETLSRLDAELDRAEAAPLIFETVHRRKDGTTFPVEVAAQGVVIDGERLMVSIIRDISERRLAQQELRSALNQAVDAARLKSEFLATMSHEIRTPLNAVIGMTELLLHSQLSDDQRHCATVAHESGQTLLHLINDILDFSKIEAQRVELEFIEFRMIALVEGVAGIFASQAARNHVALMTYVNPRIPQALLGDPGRLRQILTNLTGNAVKFTQNGSVVLTADVERERAGDSIDVHFAVQDTGIGIDPQTLQNLFEPFRQADGSMTRRFGGTGLGLSISKSLVELMGGSIRVQSAPGEGSTFSFTLTLKCAQGQPHEPPDLSAMRALVVDDDPIAQEIFARYLTSWQMRCDTVGDPAHACAMVETASAAADHYDVVLVDLMLPHMDGFEFARRLQDSEGIDRTRLIMVTAYDEPERGRQAIEAGFSAYLTKPVRQSQLYDCIVNAASGVLPQDFARTAHAAAEPKHGRRILVAEDNAINREVALRQLGKLGFAAQAVTDGSHAVEAALSGQFDVVLMDCQMPVMDGFEATRAIRKGEARSGTRVRIVAMTANALAEDRQACMDAGMDDYIAKPVTLEALSRVLGSGEKRESLDLRRLDELFEGDRRGVNEFLASALPALLRIINRVEESSDTNARLAAAHELKGAAANIGAAEIAAVAAQIEKHVRSGQNDCSALIGALHEAYERAVGGARTLELEA